MEWLVGLITLIVAIRFWKASLILVGIAALGIGGLLFFEHQQNEREKAERARNEAEITEYIRNARESATAEGITWKVRSRRDPASEQLVPGSAIVQSNDGLCRLSVERRITGAELTGIYCDRLKIKDWNDIQVKFDNYETSNAMRIEKFSEGKDVYIPRDQDEFRRHLDYGEFIRRLGTGKAVSLRLDTSNAGAHWITFTLNGSSEALELVYGN